MKVKLVKNETATTSTIPSINEYNQAIYEAIKANNGYLDNRQVAALVVLDNGDCCPVYYNAVQSLSPLDLVDGKVIKNDFTVGANITVRDNVLDGVLEYIHQAEEYQAKGLQVSTITSYMPF